MLRPAFGKPLALALAVASISCKDDSPPVPTKLLVTTAPSATAANRTVFATQPVIQLTDNGNKNAPKAGVVVTAAVTTANATIGGTATATTNESGTATFTNLQINGVAAAHQIEFTADGLQSVTAPVTTTAGSATTIASNAGNGQTATVNTAVATAPSAKVTDADGNAVSGTAVTFAVTAGGGSVAGASQTTNAAGVATVTSWTLGTTAGSNTLQATSGSLAGSPVSFTATGNAGAASKLAVVTAPSSTAPNRVAFATQPAMRLQDQFNNNVSQTGVTVNAAITSGGGTLQGTPSVVTDASGVATFTNLAIAGTVGARTISFTATGLTATTANVTTTAGAATTIAVNAGNNQNGVVNTQVGIAPSAKVTDQDANAVSGVAVTWAVTSGGGSATGTSTTTNTNGVATVGSWTLGPSAGTNTMTATSSGLTGSPVTFTATAATSAFNVEVVFLTSMTAAQQAAFTSAANRWMSIITADVADVGPVSLPANDCSFGDPAFNGTIDDIIIYAKVEAIDGPGGVLGSAGPCRLRNGSLLPVTGTMRFDSADLATLEASGSLTTVILHEMGHVLGIGTIWDPAFKNLIVGSGGSNPYFTGTEANLRFDDIGGTGYSGSPGVPVENTGGTGTRDAHWRETNFETELMTGFIDVGSNPLSVVTIGSLKDLGYTVNLAQADGYTLFSTAALRIGPSRKIHLVNDIRSIPPRLLPELSAPPRRP